ncbi:MAG: DUF2586 family protein [Bacteroidota bacterium]
MPQSAITFTKQSGGLGRPLAGEDHISGIIFYSGVLPTGFGTDSEKAFFSLAEAVAAGITSINAYKVLHYHLSEFFRMNPKGVIWVGIYDNPADFLLHDYAEINTLQLASSGKIRQVALYLEAVTTVNTTVIAAIQSRSEELFALHMPLIALVAFDISAIADLGTLPDLRALTAYYVSVVIGEDGNATGKALADSEGLAITCLGASLGLYSLAQVHENIGYVRKFRASEVELDLAAFANGDLYSNLSAALIDQLNDRGYTYLRTYVGVVGSYFNGTPTAVTSTSDFAYQENNRTIDKAIRLVYAALVSELNGPVNIDATSGQLSNSYVEYLKGIGDQALAQMERAGELSGYQTLIDPTQNVQATGTIEASVELVAIGVARNFTVNIGFKQQLS